MKWLVLGLAAALAACSPDALPTVVRKLDRPVDIAFGCISARPDASGDEATIALPLSACAATDNLDLPEVPGGPEGMQTVATPIPMGFVLQSARGEVVLSESLAGLDDADRLSPGFNGIAVGALPVAIETSADGCSAVTANAGSCDLTVIDVRLARLKEEGAIKPRPFLQNGAVISPRPAALAVPPSLPSNVLPECGQANPPSAGVRTAWVAFPGCNLVARVDLPTGAILDGVQMGPNQAPTLVGPNDFTCPDECVAGKLATDLDAGAPPDAEGRQPVALTMDPAGDRLYVGSHDASELLIIGLDASGKAQAVASVPLEGALGIKRMAATGPVAMGQEGNAGSHEFVYIAAEDGTVHVVDVSGVPVECDTQINRRALHGFADFSLFSCFPVGRPGNPPRRPGSRGPGIRLPGDVPPTDLTVFVLNPEPDKATFDTSPTPSDLNGTFVFVSTNSSVPTGARGALYIINVDDDSYPDVEGADVSDTLAPSDVSYALPHSLRDNTSRRRDVPAECRPATGFSGIEGPPRLSADPERTTGVRVNFDSAAGDVVSPMVAMVQCANTTSATFALGATAPKDTRKIVFPDILQLPQSATYTVTWEGPLSSDALVDRRNGALVAPSGGTLHLSDDSGLICDLGAEVSDIVQLLGCKTDADCNPGDTCYAHPEAPAGIDGMCLPTANVVDLSSLCRDVLISQRRYSAVEVTDTGLTLVPRPKQLEATPIEGCASAEECTTLENDELVRRETNAGVPVGTVARHTWACAGEPTIGPQARCLMTCGSSSQCVAGSVCSAGRCVLGTVPPAACLETLQRYQVRAGDAFSVVSNRTGYRHRQVRDVDGHCVTDALASPLLVARFTKYEPVCDPGDPLMDLEPNPCRLESTQPILASGEVASTRPSTVTRLRLPEVTLDVADTAQPIPTLDGKTYSPVLDGYFFRFQIAAGFLPMARVVGAALPVRIKKTPSGSIIVIDGGDQPDTPSIKGQVIQLRSDASDIATIFN